MKTKPGRPPSTTGQRTLAPAAIQRAFDKQNWGTLHQVCLARLKQQPNDLYAHRYLGVALHGLAKPEQAMHAFEHANAIHPNDPPLMYGLSRLREERHDLQGAYDLVKQAAVLAPNTSEMWISLTSLCYSLGKHQEAVNACQQALQLPLDNADKVMLLNNLSINLRDLGRLDEALAACWQVIRLSPKFFPAYTNLLLFSQSHPEAKALEIRETARLYQQQFEAPHTPNWPTHAQRDADPLRRLRVGFLSPDFNSHAVMYFVEGLLPQLDRRQFELIALAMKSVEDQVTLRTKRHVDGYHDLSKLTDEQRSQRIQALEIDILIDLAGHTAGNGLNTMTHKPAPVQVTWLGYPGTTGLTAIDWRLTDGIADQPGADAEYSEKLWRLPEVFCVYRPLSRFPLQRYQPAYQVQPAPAVAKGFITFGCCNNLSKLTDTVLRTWAGVLRAVPGSKLLIEGKGLEQGQARDEFEARCVALGLEAQRLILIARDSSQQYLTYHHIDIALDPFPLTGGTTSTDVLWMGLPLVSMVGDSFRSRMGMTLLHNLGHPEWIAKDEQDYVGIAAELAADVPLLNHRRLKQRRRMETSALMDEARFARHFGAALRNMWQRWCAGRQFGGDTVAAESALQAWAQHPWSPQPPQVTVATGQVLSLPAAHAHLQALTATALAEAPRSHLVVDQQAAAEVSHPAWLKVHEWASYLLDAIPNEALALATLAEIEHAHGHTEFATTYLHYAQLALAQPQG
jgi:protein O-GlcNAc transferase